MNRHLDKERTKITYGVEILTEDYIYVAIPIGEALDCGKSTQSYRD